MLHLYTSTSVPERTRGQTMSVHRGCSRLLALLLLSECLLRVSAHYFTPVVVKVKDVTIRVDKEGLWGEWEEERGWKEQHHVVISSPTISPHTLEQLTLTSGANGFHIPSSELIRYGFIDMNVVTYGNDGELFNVSIYLEQGSDTTDNSWGGHLPATPRLLLVLLAVVLCLVIAALLAACGGGWEEGGLGERLRTAWDQRKERWRGGKTSGSGVGGDGRYIKLLVGLKHEQLVQKV